MEAIQDLIDHYQTKEYLSIRNIYVFGSSLYTKSVSSVPPNDIDLIMVVAAVPLPSRADRVYLKKRGWLPPFVKSVPLRKYSRKGVDGF
jgi:hypothetical protein